MNITLIKYINIKFPIYSPYIYMDKRIHSKKIPLHTSILVVLQEVGPFPFFKKLPLTKRKIDFPLWREPLWPLPNRTNGIDLLKTAETSLFAQWPSVGAGISASRLSKESRTGWQEQNGEHRTFYMPDNQHMLVAETPSFGVGSEWKTIVVLCSKVSCWGWGRFYDLIRMGKFYRVVTLYNSVKQHFLLGIWSYS